MGIRQAVVLLFFCAPLSIVWSANGQLSAAPIDASPPGRSDISDQPPEIAQAIAAFRQRDIKSTRDWLERAAHEHAELAPAEVMLASMYFSDDQPAKGRELLEQATVKHPDDPEPNLIFGDLAWRERRLSDAQVQYERGGQLTANFAGSPKRKQQLKVRALAGLANVAEARGQFEVAHKWYSALLKTEPQHPQAHFRLGNVLFAMKRPDEALAEFRAAAALVESAPSATLTLAELYQRAGDDSRAEHWLEQAIKESADDAMPLLAMAHWQLEARNDPKLAASYVDRAETLEPNSIEIPLLQGIIAWTTGNTSRAEQLLESVVLRQPAHATANLYLATVLAEQDDPQRRQRAFEIVQLQISNKKPTPEMAAASGWVAYHLGEFDRAERELQFAATSPGGGRDAVYYWSRALFRRGKIAQAQQALDRALSTSGLFIHLDEARQWQNELGQPDR